MGFEKKAFLSYRMALITQATYPVSQRHEVLLSIAFLSAVVNRRYTYFCYIAVFEEWRLAIETACLN